MVACPVARSMFAMWLPASEAYQMSPDGVAVMPYGPRPSGSSKTSIEPVAGSSRPKMPVWPVNQRMPSVSKTAVFRLAPGRSLGEREGRDLVGVGIDPDDRVQAAVGDPGVAVRPGDDAVGRGPGTERDRPDVSGRGVEVAERAVVLAGVPDAAVRRGRDVVRMRAGHDVELPDLEGDGGPGGWRRGRGGAGVARRSMAS